MERERSFKSQKKTSANHVLNGFSSDSIVRRSDCLARGRGRSHDTKCLPGICSWNLLDSKEFISHEGGWSSYVSYHGANASDFGRMTPSPSNAGSTVFCGVVPPNVHRKEFWGYWRGYWIVTHLHILLQTKPTTTSDDQNVITIVFLTSYMLFTMVHYSENGRRYCTVQYIWSIERATWPAPTAVYRLGKGLFLAPSWTARLSFGLI
jgi:hypothetical protein